MPTEWTWVHITPLPDALAGNGDRLEPEAARVYASMRAMLHAHHCEVMSRGLDLLVAVPIDVIDDITAELDLAAGLLWRWEYVEPIRITIILGGNFE